MPARKVDRKEHEHQAKLSALRVAIDEGDASGVADDGVFRRVREKLDLPSATSGPRRVSRP